MIMNLDKLIAEIFDGSLDPNASYFDITEEQRDDIAKKFISINMELFQSDKDKMIFYAEYFQWMRDKATEKELYETADLYERLMKILYQQT
jgi:hypothetical protein